jgi:hypothetical protein
MEIKLSLRAPGLVKVPDTQQSWIRSLFGQQVLERVQGPEHVS